MSGSRTAGRLALSLAQGKTDAAIAAYKAGIAATKGAPPLVTDLATLYEQLGRIDDAIAEYEACSRATRATMLRQTTWRCCS